MDITAIADTATGGAIGGIMDLAFGGIKNKRALKQDRKIGRQQMAREKEMSQFGMELGLNKMRKTPQAMRDAGLNVGLMYGGSGAGGQSTAQVTNEGTSAPTDMSSTSQGMGMQLAQQKVLQEAQIKNIEADTEKKKVEAVKLAGVDTSNVQADTDKKEKEAIQLSAQTGLTLEQSRLVIAQQNKTKEETTNIQTDTTKKEAEIKKIEKETDWMDDLNGATIRNINSEIRTRAEQLKQNWKKLNIEEQQKEIHKFSEEMKVKYPNAINVLGGITNDFIKMIDNLTGGDEAKEKIREKVK